jgi:hypothetical protein
MYFAIQAGLSRYLSSVLLFPLRYYSAESGLNSFHLSMLTPPRWGEFRYVPDPGWLIVHLLIPFIYLPFLFMSLRRVRIDAFPFFDRLLLLSLVGFFAYLPIAPAPTDWRVSVVAMPGLILFIWWLSTSGRLCDVARWSLWCATIATAVPILWAQQTRPREILETSIGSAAYFDDAAYQRMKWTVENTHRVEPFFDCSGQAYFLLGLWSPARVSFVTDSDYMRPSQVQDLVASLEREHARVIFWCPNLNTARRPDDHLAALRSYLNSNYHPVNVPENTGAVLLRNSSSPGIVGDCTPSVALFDHSMIQKRGASN